MTALYGLRCDVCDAVMALRADEGQMWLAALEDGWQASASVPEHRCPMCREVQS